MEVSYDSITESQTNNPDEIVMYYSGGYYPGAPWTPVPPEVHKEYRESLISSW